MKKKSIAARLGVMAVALTLVTTSLTSGTLAKYTTQYKATANAIVARWNPQAKFNGTKMTSTTTANYNFYDLVSGTVQDGVASSTIAPGMEGKVPIMINMGGEAVGKETQVDTEYEVWCSVDSTGALNKPANLKFYDDSAMTTAKDIVEAVPNDPSGTNTYGTKIASGTIEANSRTDTDASIYWKWPYDYTSNIGTSTPEQLNSRDGVDGAAAANITYTFTIILTQAQPTIATGA